MSDTLLEGGEVEVTEVTETSGCERLVGSFITALCVAPLCILIAILVTGYNEKQAVCQWKALNEGLKKVEVVTCNDEPAKTGKLIFFNCKYNSDGMKDLSPGGDFISATTKAVGITSEPEMLQCTETKSSTTRKKKGGGGGTETITTYAYIVKWQSSYIDDDRFVQKAGRDKACGARNPKWVGIPQGSQRQTRVAVGPYFITNTYVNAIPLNKPWKPEGTFKDWEYTGTKFETKKYIFKNNSQQIGLTRVGFKVDDKDKSTVSVLGQKNANGDIGQWKASASWGCGGDSIGSLKMGEISKDDFFNSEQQANTALLWILRLVGFILFWVGFHMFFAPLEVFADCIPCIGPCLGDSINIITCVLACCPATGCCLFVAGVVWIFMRPLVGLLLIGGCCCIAGAGVALKLQFGSKGGARQPSVLGAPAEEADEEVVQMSAVDPVPPFFLITSDDGRPWVEVVAGQTPSVDEDRLAGVWAFCMAAAVKYELTETDFADDPRFSEQGPAGQVIDYLRAKHPYFVEAAEASEMQLRKQFE
jgi:hypothetical protein